MPTLEASGQRVNVSLNPLGGGGWRCQVGDETLTLEAIPLGAGRWLLRHDGQQHLIYTAAQERAIHLWQNGQQLRIIHAEERARRRASAGAGDLSAQMPGQVMDVRVHVGQHVAAGAVLMVLEAMKMEIRVTAPTDGIVSALHVAAGQIVQRGQRLIDLQPVDAPSG
jgi:3-methylcrotonyl-CoA carboxylase alpha subunit